jgi:hypothetical protein
MKILARRRKIEWLYFGFGLAMSAWFVAGLYQGQKYIPGGFAPGRLYVRADNPESFLGVIQIQAVMSAFFVLVSFVHSPRYASWNLGMERRLRTERWTPPTRRSLLWKFTAFILLPLAVFLVIVPVVFGAR